MHGGFEKMILITGGAGYIGAHVAKQLLEQDYDIIVLDNLSTGTQSAIDTLQKIKKFEFVQIDLKAFDEVSALFEQYNIDIVMHFAASIVVPESILNPLKYYLNNTVNTVNLLKCAMEHNVKKFIFSSTAAVYGEPKAVSYNGIDETFPTQPINPYGQSKLMSEQIIQDAAKVKSDFKYVIFRYFNVSGADMHFEDERLSPRIGQSFPNATHLIKIVSECAVGKRDQMFIFGEDYDTHDGTCIRDYIHVDDLARAHIDAIAYLESHESNIFNVGYGKGYSVKEVVQTAQNVTCKAITYEITQRRQGDPAFLVADNGKIISKMGWKPCFNDLEVICESAVTWEKILK